jgi:DNA-binding transcriptional LysR family regulator
MQVDAIKLFCDVAQHRSISRGAELNGVTQSAASQRIMSLERELGVQLIDRTKRPLQLTHSGELYHRGCRRILDHYERLRQQVARAHAPLRGDVVVSAIYSSGIDLMKQVQAEFADVCPEAQVQIDYVHPDQVYDRVRTDQCHLGILSYPDRWRGLASVLMRKEMMVLACRAEHPLAEREEIHAEELVNQPLVMFDANLPINRRIRSYLRRHGVRARVVQTFDNIDTIKSYAAETDAVAILPLRTVRREAQQGILSVVRLEPTLTRPLAVVYRRGRQLPPLVRTFMQYLLDHQPPALDLKDVSITTVS